MAVFGRTMALDAVNPATGETFQSYDEMTPQQTAAAVAEAHEAWKAWRKAPFADRARPMKNHEGDMLVENQCPMIIEALNSRLLFLEQGLGNGDIMTGFT